MKLYYDQPARNWHESLPLGNGRLGATVYGGTKIETLALNEDTLWSGFPEKTQPVFSSGRAQMMSVLRSRSAAAAYAEARGTLPNR